MFGNSWRVGKIAGIEIRVDSSWTVVALLITYSLYVRFRFLFDDLSRGGAVVLAIVAAVLFFGSVLAHEMAHALVSLARGIRVQDITLFLFGGATRAKVESKGPADEFLIAVVGPLTSLGLAVVFWVLATVGDAVLPEAVAGALGYLGLVNLTLALFNLVPGFPLDGGRLLRSAIWKATGSLPRATRIAGIAGQAVGWLLVAGGLLSLMAGSLGGGIWLAFIGWFLVQAARQSYEEIQLRQILEKVEAEDVMARNLLAMPPTITIQDAVDDYFMRYDHGAFPVQADGRTVGLLTLRGVKRVPRDEWDARRVEEVMSPLSDHVSVSSHTRMDRVMARLQDEETHRLLVLDEGEVVGIITPHDVARWLQRWRQFEEGRASV
jgi:Zn-dependent protease/CBS domain-containing protein